LQIQQKGVNNIQTAKPSDINKVSTKDLCKNAKRRRKSNLKVMLAHKMNIAARSTTTRLINNPSAASSRAPPSSFFHKSAFLQQARAAMSTVPSWASADPATMGKSATPHAVRNCVGGKWVADTAKTMSIPDPIDKDAHPIFTIPDTQVSEIQPFIDSLRKVSKSGVHNPLKNPERYVQYGEISRRVSFVSCLSSYCPH
jgi:hypothetical protein